MPQRLAPALQYSSFEHFGKNERMLIWWFWHAGVVKTTQLAPSTPAQPDACWAGGPAQELWSQGHANATDAMLQQIIPDLWPHDLPQSGKMAAVQPLSAGSEASAESAVPEAGEKPSIMLQSWVCQVLHHCMDSLRLNGIVIALPMHAGIDNSEICCQQECGRRPRGCYIAGQRHLH